MKSLKLLVALGMLGYAGSAEAQSSLIGGWYFGDDSTVYTFAQDGTYFLGHDFGPVGGPGIGVEVGSYSWNSGSGQFSSPGYTYQSDGAQGLFANASSPAFTTTTSFSADGNTLTFNGMTGVRISDPSNPLVGSWIGVNSNDVGSPRVNAVTFLSNGQYFDVAAGPFNANNSGHTGVEHGTYSWNQATGELGGSSPVGHDTSGTWGINDPSATATVSVVNDLLKLSDDSGFVGYAVRAVEPELLLPSVPPASVSGIWSSSAPFFFFNDIPTSAWADPLFTDTFYYQATGSSLFTLIGLPSGAWNNFEIFDGLGNLIGTVAPGSYFTFATPTDHFSISGINPLVDSLLPTAFPLQVFFDQSAGDFIMGPAPFIAVAGSAVPEPSTYGLVASALLLFAAGLNRHRMRS